MAKSKKSNIQRSNNNVAGPVLQRSTNVVEGFVSGVILDQTGQPLPGANVVVKGTTTGVQTDFDGKFTIQAPENSELEISFIGAESTQVNVGRNNMVTVNLRENSNTLQEVVTIGYGISKGDADAVLTVDEPIGAGPVQEVIEDIKDKKVASEEVRENNNIQRSVSFVPQETTVAGLTISQSLAGKVAGVEIKSANERDLSLNYSVTDTLSFDSKNEDKNWNPDRLYLKALAKAPKEKQYDLYFELRKVQERNPSFYFDVAHFFYNQGDVKKALLVISNIADLGLENHQLYKTLTYTLRQWKDYDDALFTAKQVAKWREHEPQSLRDYALTLEDAGKYQEAFDQLIKALEVNYYGEMDGQYEGVEDIILMDINRLMTAHSGLKTGKLNKKYMAKMPVDIRIIMNWNQMDVDLDLHVIEPTGEECYYSHTSTAIGGRFSKILPKVTDQNNISSEMLRKVNTKLKAIILEKQN